ncbi:hypothetical protein B0I03_10548 [Flavobacterium aquaticum]|uniref:Uncharacterized protein n=1 Tax=Flavobacterium aquaticum TaxID=1236486 RepID=A0A327YMY3_9FLAO|nr:hypothetical protein [Flavobacterium aquaticum]RAK21616.1 hypothetical protein B0I03_10548 [Flavobacterium aquaticum]
MFDDNDRIIKEEFEAIKADIIALYNAGGKRTSGEFENGLQVDYRTDGATLSGYVYLAGRIAGKQPPTKAIEDWLIQKGIQPIEEKMKISTLAYLIARKIGQKGTKKENHQYVYDEVITPERIQSILDRITKINVTAFINEVTVAIEKLVTNK